jgi:hypothetical protein
MIRDAILIYSIYSAALIVAGIVAYIVFRVFASDIDDPP